MYSNKYYIQFTNDLGEFIEIYFAFLDYTGPLIEVTASSAALEIKNTGGDEDKLFNMCGAEAYIKFLIEDDSVSIDDFVADQDLAIEVFCYMNRQYDQSIFQGFIVAEDNSQPFVDPPFEVTVRCTDGIGLLKGVYFLKTDGTPFSGALSITQWLAQCLYQTGQTLKLRTYFNIRNTAFLSNGNPLDQTFIDAITFETGTQTPSGDTNPADFSTGFVDFFTALEYICRNFRAKLFQENGCWHFVNLFEYLNKDGYTYYEYTIGTPVAGLATITQTGSGTNVDYTCTIGKKEIITPIKEDGMQYLRLAYKSIEYTYNYDQSLNKICNQDLTQGIADHTHDEVISSSIIDQTIKPPVNLNTFGYNAFCYDTFDGTITSGILLAAYPANSSTGSIFIRQVLDELGYDMTRFLVIKQNGTADLICCRTNKLLIDASDILQLTFSWRTRASHTPVLQALCFIYLYGDDGTYWALDSKNDGSLVGNPTVWRQVDSNFRNTPIQPNGSFFCEMNPSGDISFWQSASINTSHEVNAFYAIAPVSGSVEIIFFNQGGGLDELWMKDISVTILPYLKGTYKALKGDYNFSSQNALIKQTIQDEVQISDSPKRYFKGALYADGTGLKLLPPSWTLPSSVSPMIITYRFTQLMEYCVFSNVCRMVIKIEGSMKGFVFIQPDLIITRAIGLLNTYYFVNSKWPDKAFMCTSYDKDYTTGQWRGVFVETRKDMNDMGLKLPDTFIFAYLFQT